MPLRCQAACDLLIPLFNFVFSSLARGQVIFAALSPSLFPKPGIPWLPCCLTIRRLPADVRVSEPAVLAQAAHHDGGTGQEEHQPDDHPCHQQRGHQQVGVTAVLRGAGEGAGAAALVRGSC